MVSSVFDMSHWKLKIQRKHLCPRNEKADLRKRKQFLKKEEVGANLGMLRK